MSQACPQAQTVAQSCLAWAVILLVACVAMQMDLDLAAMQVKNRWAAARGEPAHLAPGGWGQAAHQGLLLVRQTYCGFLAMGAVVAKLGRDQSLPEVQQTSTGVATLPALSWSHRPPKPPAS